MMLKILNILMCTSSIWWFQNPLTYFLSDPYKK